MTFFLSKMTQLSIHSRLVNRVSACDLKLCVTFFSVKNDSVFHPYEVGMYSKKNISLGFESLCDLLCFQK